MIGEPQPKIYRIDDLVLLLSLSERTIYNYVDAGTFPRPVMLGPRARGWRADEVQRWLDSRPKTTTDGETK